MLFPMIVFTVIGAGLMIVGLQKSTPPRPHDSNQMKLFRKN